MRLRGRILVAGLACACLGTCATRRAPPAASAISWAIIAKKWMQIRRAQDESVRFLETFWGSKRLDAIYEKAGALGASPLGQVFRAGYVELSKVTAHQKAADGSAMVKLPVRFVRVSHEIVIWAAPVEMFLVQPRIRAPKPSPYIR
mgnify:CR=1 FL=1